MYKQKLHELCQKKKWGKPEYSTIKDGSDHSPRFESSVTVAGFSFNSPSFFNSSKKSQNDAAKIAFVHFSSSSPDQDFHSEFKDQLQNYAQFKNVGTASYYSRIEGPEFKSTVVINGRAFESPESFTDLNEAENATAEFVLLSIASDDLEEENPIFYKNLLQEMAQKQCLSSPLYSTVKTGASHVPTFYSFVEMEGEKFYGKAGKSKKAAEASAAKVAYTYFEEIAVTRREEFLPPIPETDELNSNSSDDFELNTVVNPDLNVENSDEFVRSSSSVIIDEWVAVDD